MGDEVGLDSPRSWLMTAAAAASMFTVFGVAYSFGAFFDAMSEEFGVGSGATALVFAITISLSFILGSFTGRMADVHGPAPVLRLGAVSLTVGLLLTTVVPSIVVGYVTYGLGVGLAVACGYVPMVTVVGGWFERQRTTALGVAVAGIGLGTLVGSPLAAALIDAFSWRTTYVVYALVGGGILLGVSFVAERGPATPPAPEPRPLRELLRLRTFSVLYASATLVSFGLFVPFVFLASYAEDNGMDAVAAASLVGVIGGSSVIGRLGLGAAAARTGAVPLYRACFVVMAVAHTIWLVAGETGWLLFVYAAVLGFGYGGFIALSPAVTAEAFGLEGLGAVLGTLYTSAAIGALLGPPLAGVLIDQLSYEAAIVWAAAVSAAGAAVLVMLPRPSTTERTTA